jgi:hypothetical protein
MITISKRFGLILLMASAIPSWATTMFVRSTSTSSAGNSWASAWKDVSSISWSALKPGDVVCVAGGTYSGSISTQASGQSGKPITIRRATAADTTCGSKTTGWSAAYDSQAVIGGVSLGNDYVTIDGAVANGFKLNLVNSSGDPSAISVVGPTNGVILRYIEVSGPCGTSACNQNGDSRSIDLNHWNGSSYDLQNNMTIQYDNLHGACTILWSAHSSNLIIEHTRFADSADSTPGNPNCHPNVVAEQDSTNVSFRYNEVTNWQVEGIMACPNGGCSSSWNLYGNIWHDPMAGSYPRVLEAQGSASGPYYVYNNTFVNVSYATITSANGGSYTSDSMMRNNIFWNSSTGGLANRDYDLCNTSCGETNGQTFTSTGLFVNYSAENYALAQPTTAGATLPSPFNIDYIGDTRGADGTWDRGAYEYVANVTKPGAPTHLTAPSAQ